MLKQGKGFPILDTERGPGADPGVQAVSLHVTVSHPPGGRLPLLSARPAVTSPAAQLPQHHRPLAGTKLYCLVTEAHRCEQLAQGCYAALPRPTDSKSNAVLVVLLPVLKHVKNNQGANVCLCMSVSRQLN